MIFLFFVIFTSPSSSKKAAKAMGWMEPFAIMKYAETNKIFQVSNFIIFQWTIKSFNCACNATYCNERKR